MDPPPLPFQLQDPERVRHVLTEAGLEHIHVETTTEKLEFQSGAQLWNWLPGFRGVAELTSLLAAPGAPAQVPFDLLAIASGKDADRELR